MITPSFALLSCRGPQAASFLEGHLTQRIDDMPQGAGRHAAIADHKGRVLFTLYVWHVEGVFLLLFCDASADDAMTHLHRYARFSKVQLEDITVQYASLHTVSHHAVTADRPTVGIQWAQAWSLWCPQAAATSQLPASDPSLLQRARYQALHPEITVDQRGLHLANHLDLFESQAIGKDKGCYLGQEVIIRLAHRGQKKRSLIHLQGTAEATLDALRARGQVVCHHSDRTGQRALCVWEHRLWEQWGTPWTRQPMGPQPRFFVHPAAS